MSLRLPVAGASVALPATSKWKTISANLLREPLLQFLVLGALLFAIHAAVTPSVSKERLIEVTPQVRQSIVDLYKEKHDKEPTREELDHLINTWILNEVTYREALALGLDKGDDMIRERIMQKMRLLIFGNLKVEEPSENQLTDWLESRRAQYDIPDTLSFFEVSFAGQGGEADAKAMLQQIDAGNEPEELRLRARIFADRPRTSLEASFGKQFFDQLAALPVGKWQVLQSQAGWHIVRLDSFNPGHAVKLSEIQTQLLNEWKDDNARRQGAAAIQELSKAYVIRRGEP